MSSAMNGQKRSFRRPCGIVLYRPGPAARVRVILARVRELRRNIYPEGWDTDPLKKIEQEIEALLKGIA